MIVTAEIQAQRKRRSVDDLTHGSAIVTPDDNYVSDVTTLAYVSASRWVVHCPFCQGAQLASESRHRYYCHNCQNQKVSGRWVEVIWPSADERRAVERVLDRRPNPEMRGWRPGTAIEELDRQNRDDGLDMP
jgi:hypothetical protein